VADVKIYTVTAVADYIPSIILATLDKETAIARGREYAGDWGNEQATESGELLFNQRDEGSMENAVSVQETELATPHPADRGTEAQITDVAEAILWNDGIEEYPAELVDFARVAIDVPESQQPGKEILKAATHAAFGAMLLGLPIRDAVDMVLAYRGDILEG
jgi:hypothetical protein